MGFGNWMVGNDGPRARVEPRLGTAVRREPLAHISIEAQQSAQPMPERRGKRRGGALIFLLFCGAIGWVWAANLPASPSQPSANNVPLPPLRITAKPTPVQQSSKVYHYADGTVDPYGAGDRAVKTQQYAEAVNSFLLNVQIAYFAVGCQVFPGEAYVYKYIDDQMTLTNDMFVAWGMPLDPTFMDKVKAAESKGTLMAQKSCAYWRDNPDAVRRMRQVAAG